MIFILLELGKVAIVSGLIMAYATLWMYNKFAGKLSGLRVIISFIIMIFTTYLSDRISWAKLIVKKFDVDFITAFREVHNAVQTNSYVQNIAMLMFFVLVGIILGAKSFLGDEKAQSIIEKLD